MLIEWETGERITTPIALQEKILTRMEKDVSASTGKATRTSPAWMGRTFAGLSAGDFKGDVDGTHWRSREQLGGAVTCQTDSPVPFNSWPIYRRPEIHWASINHYHTDDAWVQSKFYIRLQEDSAIYGFYTERSNDPGEARADWLSFLNWLVVKSHADWLHQTLMDRGMWIFDPYPEADSAFNRSIRPRKGEWFVEGHGARTNRIAISELANYLSAVEEGKWLDLLVGRQRPANELVSAGVNVAVEIAADFNVLLPVYLNKTPIPASVTI